MALILKHKAISVLLAAMVLAAAVFSIFKYSDSFRAQADSREWKNFREADYGFSMDYPAGWSLNVSYDRYSKGLMNADLSNKKCGFNSKQCDADCADIRILVGKKPSRGEASGLLTQLYEDFMMVRDFSQASLLVATLDLGAKKVFKVDDDALTLALNGVCAGPLYVFETDSGNFAYVFAGYGSNAAGNPAEVEKIISSISIK